MNQLSEIIKTSGLEVKETQSIVERFGNYEEIAKEWEAKAKMIVVTNASQTTEMAMAREARKKFSNLRIEVEHARKAMKEQSLRKGQAIDAVAKFLISLIAPIEQHLRTQEDFVEIQQKKKEEEDRIAAEKKAEEDRIAKEKADAEERECIRLENEKLKKEAEERERKIVEDKKKADAEKKALEEKARKQKEEADKKLSQEKAKAEEEKKKLQEEQAKKLEAERLEKEKAQKELNDKKLEEEKRKKEAEEAEIKRLADIEKAKQEELKKPDVEKYNAYIQVLLDVEVPIVRDMDVSNKIDIVWNYLKSLQK